MTDSPTYLLIGHVTHDVTPTGPKLGGTVSYAGAAVHALGVHAAIVTSARRDEVVLERLPSDLPVHLIEAPASTVFINTYENGKRQQVMPSRALTLSLAHVPQHWRSAPVVHLAPLDDEVDPDLAFAFDGALVGATPQGWMRVWDSEGVISPKPWAHAERLLPHLGATIFSEEDIHWDRDLEAYYASLARLLIITRADKGCTVYQQGHDPFDILAPQVEVVEATGAGDIFTGVFLVALRRLNNLTRAAEVAVQLASLSVTRAGMDSVPTVTELRAVLSEVEFTAMVAREAR